MLKALQNNTFDCNITNAKCGEIYCQDTAEFSIMCTLCELKSFEYEDFIFHFKNIHIENSLLKTEEVNIRCTPYLEDIEEPSVDYSPLLEPTISTKINVQEEEHSSEFSKWDKATDDSEDAQNEDSTTDNINPKVDVHIKKQQTKYKCEYCSKICFKPSRLQLHIKKDHPLFFTPPILLKCTECSEEFQGERRLSSHYAKVHNGVQCSECSKRFKYKSKLMEHMEVHAPSKSEANFICDLENCSRRFSSSRRLADHRRRCGKPKNFICDICGYRCQLKGALRIHYRKHTNERPYPCSVCNIRFKEKHKMIRHAEIHTYGDEKSFFCNFENCAKSFSTSHNLAQHKRRHTKLEKYRCDVCGYSYKEKQSLQIHYRKHMGDIPTAT